MRARVFDRVSGITLFGLDITEQKKGDFERFLAANGFEYVKHRDVFVNKRYECIIYKDWTMGELPKRTVFGHIMPESELQEIVNELGYIPSEDELEAMYYYENKDNE